MMSKHVHIKVLQPNKICQKFISGVFAYVINAVIFSSEIFLQKHIIVRYAVDSQTTSLQLY